VLPPIGDVVITIALNPAFLANSDIAQNPCIRRILFPSPSLQAATSDPAVALLSQAERLAGTHGAAVDPARSSRSAIRAFTSDEAADRQRIFPTPGQTKATALE
jgi:hypothetical protein